VEEAKKILKQPEFNKLYSKCHWFGGRIQFKIDVLFCIQKIHGDVAFRLPEYKKSARRFRSECNGQW